MARAYASLDELLDDPSVDVVHVTSPNHLHVPQTEADPGGRPARRLREAAGDDRGRVGGAGRAGRESGLVNAVNFNIRFYPLHQHVRELVAGWGLGDIRFVTGHYFQDWLLLETDWNWRLEPDKGGSLRAVGDIGSHWLDLVTFLTGQPIVAGDGRPGDVHPVARPAARPGRDLLDGSERRHRRTRDGDRGRRDRSCCASPTAPAARWPSRRSAPAARTRCSGRSTAPGLGGLGLGDAGPPVARSPRTGERDPAAQPGAHGSGRSSGVGPAGRPRRRASATRSGHCSGPSTRTWPAGHPAERPPYATFADGHDEMLVGDAIAESARLGRWVDVDRAPARVGRPMPWRRRR